MILIKYYAFYMLNSFIYAPNISLLFIDFICNYLYSIRFNAISILICFNPLL